MYWSVKSVKPLADYRLELIFANAEKRIFDVTPYLDHGLFRELRDRRFFDRAHIDFDSVAWSDRIDLDPEVLYEKSVLA
ncbi:MAG: DUF2442 domain-containing protein [Planctomycetota bacterium]|jgi:hypothetical protein|nr:DUF2442 domain-containing protein [Planctomycetota bacterium]